MSDRAGATEPADTVAAVERVAAADIEALMRVDRTSPVPLYFQVAEEMQRLIRSDALPAGTKLTNEIDLADMLGVSRPTMRKAIGYLVDRGLVVRKRGVGTQVVGNQVSRSIELTSLHDDLRRDGRQPKTSVLSLHTEPAEERVAAALGCAPGAHVLCVRRLRSADEEPIAVMTNYLPPDLLEITQETLETRGLYEVMRSAGIRIRVADQTIGARTATAAEGLLLGEDAGTALLTMERTAYDDGGRAVEFGAHVYRATRYSFSLTLVER